ncbi:hypothetical protein SB783_18130 [Paraburkholderia sp. SIMBA_009]
MGEESAYPINSIDGYETTEDGKYLLIRTDQPVAIAVAADALPNLVNAATDGLSKALAAQGVETKPAFDCPWWEIGIERDSQNMVISLSLNNGAKIHFRMPTSQAAPMRDVLSTIAGDGPTGAPTGVTRQ